MSNEIPYPNNYVDLVQNGQVRIQNVSADLEAQLVALGGTKELEKRTGHYALVLRVPDEVSLGVLVGQLRDLGVSFVGAGPMPASDDVELMRDRGLVNGKFRAVVWRGPGNWYTEER
jgi:hypothetical protein